MMMQNNPRVQQLFTCRIRWSGNSSSSNNVGVCVVLSDSTRGKVISAVRRIATNKSSSWQQLHQQHQLKAHQRTQQQLRQRFSSSTNNSTVNSSSSSKIPQPRATVTGAPIDGKTVIQIPAHTLTFTVLSIPCAMLAIYVMSYGPTEEDVNAEIRARYGNNVQVQQKNQAMREFFINSERGMNDERLQQVLRGGKGEKKRMHAVDQELYGTEQGVVVKQQITDEIQQTTEEKKRLRKEKRRKNKQQQQQQVAAVNDGGVPDNDGGQETTTTSLTSKINKVLTSLDQEKIKTVATYSLIGTAAVAIGFLAGSSSSSKRS